MITEYQKDKKQYEKTHRDCEQLKEDNEDLQWQIQLFAHWKESYAGLKPKKEEARRSRTRYKSRRTKR